MSLRNSTLDRKISISTVIKVTRQSFGISQTEALITENQGRLKNKEKDRRHKPRSQPRSRKDKCFNYDKKGHYVKQCKTSKKKKPQKKKEGEEKLDDEETTTIMKELVVFSAKDPVYLCDASIFSLARGFRSNSCYSEEIYVRDISQ